MRGGAVPARRRDLRIWHDRVGMRLDDDELSLAAIAEWGPAEEWGTGSMRRGEVWFAATPGGDRSVLVLTRDPVAERIGAVVVAGLRRLRRGLVSELDLTPSTYAVPADCVVNFDNIRTVGCTAFRHHVTGLSQSRMGEACRALAAAAGC